MIVIIIDQNKELSFKRKAYEDIKDMFETRRRMHELVYQHPVSIQYDTVYIRMLLKIYTNNKIFDENCDCDYKLDTLLMRHPKTKEIY
jgi:HD superfamily phosphohydrolase